MSFLSQKWVWALIVGGLLTFFVYRTHKIGGIIVAVGTLALAWYFYKMSS
jgi:hypothetical protein